jgi:transposase
VQIAALYKIEDSIRGSDPEHRRAVRQDLSLPLMDEFFTWLAAQAKRVSRKSDLGKALAYILTRQDGFRRNHPSRPATIRSRAASVIRAADQAR